MSGKRVAIIGAGIGGLVSIKCCLEEGLQPICFERHDDLGGLWYYTDELREGQGTAVYDSLITNSSKEASCFSDFPFPKEWAPYLPHQKVHQYLHSYAEHFGLKKYIKFNTDVLAIEESNTGTWKVISNSAEGKVEEYRDANRFKGKRVLVVGAASSAGDIACELARCGTIQVFMSMRGGTWVIPRLGVDSTPVDMRLISRSLVTGPRGSMVATLEKAARQIIKDPKSVGLQSPRTFLGHTSMMVNDDMQDRIMQGKLEPVVGIEKFGKNTITLNDGRILDNIDAVIFATGYDISLPFIKDNWIFDDSSDVPLYKYVFPIGLENPDRMAFIGFFKSFGAAFQCRELQARWATRIFTQKSALPNKDIMLADIEKNPKYGKCKSPQINTFAYGDEIAEEIGVKPSFWKLLFTDPKLAMAFQYGPMVPFAYRLQGPGAWSGARDAILNAWENTTAPTASYRSSENK